MSLPEEFAHVDLSSVADKSSLLVGRYKKTTEESDASNSVDLMLTKALTSLAHSIGHLDERLTRHEQGAAGKETEAGGSDPDSGNGVKVVVNEGKGAGEGGEIVHLEPEEKEKSSADGRANPVAARVLVRREAAKAAQEFWREKRGEEDWDEGVGPANRPVGFSWLMANYPKGTILVTLVLMAALVAVVILWMGGLVSDRRAGNELTLAEPQVTPLSQLMADDPEAAMAETVARAYLNATSANAALPFVWGSDSIKEKFGRYFRPLSQPGSYELRLKDRVMGEGDKPQFLYHVGLSGEKTRRLLVLLEGAMPKVFWEFFEEVGDMSWAGFLAEQPENPVKMRVWLHPVEQYVEEYDKEKWQSYMLHDSAEKHKILAYAPRHLGDDWQISDALSEGAVNFNRDNAVMALLKLTYRTEFRTGEESGAVAEINDVLATSWLPLQD
jgi:hypothetical protein